MSLRLIHHLCNSLNERGKMKKCVFISCFYHPWSYHRAPRESQLLKGVCVEWGGECLCIGN